MSCRLLEWIDLGIHRRANPNLTEYECALQLENQIAGRQALAISESFIDNVRPLLVHRI